VEEGTGHIEKKARLGREVVGKAVGKRFEMWKRTGVVANQQSGVPLFKSVGDFSERQL
jgi:hypothetical protein